MMPFNMSHVRAETQKEAIAVSERLINFAKQGKMMCAANEAKLLRGMAADCADLGDRVQGVYQSSLKYVESVCDHIDMDELRNG